MKYLRNLLISFAAAATSSGSTILATYEGDYITSTVSQHSPDSLVYEYSLNGNPVDGQSSLARIVLAISPQNTITGVGANSFYTLTTFGNLFDMDNIQTNSPFVFWFVSTNLWTESLAVLLDSQGNLAADMVLVPSSNAPVIPEPSTILLLGCMGALILLRRRR
jgi:hypothetical protein